jgi:hypothetical protein
MSLLAILALPESRNQGAASKEGWLPFKKAQRSSPGFRESPFGQALRAFLDCVANLGKGVTIAGDPRLARKALKACRIAYRLIQRSQHD